MCGAGLCALRSPMWLKPLTVHAADATNRLVSMRQEAPREDWCHLRTPAAEALGGKPGVQDLPGRPRPDRAGRPGGLRLRLGGGAPLPRRVLALLGAGGVPRR